MTLSKHRLINRPYKIKFLLLKMSLAIVIAKGGGGRGVLGGLEGEGWLSPNPPVSTAYDTFTGSYWSAYNSLRQMRNSLVLMCCKINNILS